MARTQAADYDQRREAIMQVASALYARDGFHATSVSAIAEACNASKSLLYHYFPSKEDILFEVMDSHVRSLVDAARAVESKKGTPQQKIHTFGERLMRLYEGAQDYHKVLLNELDSLPEPRRSEVVGHQRELLDIFDRLLLALRPDLAKKKGERRAATMIYFGMLNWTHTWFDSAGEVDGRRIAAMAATMFISGMSRPLEAV